MKALQQYAPLSQSHVVTAATSAPVGVEAPKIQRKQSEVGGVYRIINTGTVAVYMGVGPSAAIAQSRAVVPSVGSPSDGVLLLAGAAEVFRFGEDQFISGITVSGTADLVFTQGNGE